MILDKNKVEKAVNKFDKKIPLGKLTTDYIFKAGVSYAEGELKKLLEETVFLDGDEYTDGEIIDLIVKNFNLSR